MLKAMIIGCPGFGKSTFARKLREKINLPLYYLDNLWHRPDQTHISDQEFDFLLSQIVEKEATEYLKSLSDKLLMDKDEIEF